MNPDLTYKIDFPFVRFLPMTAQGEDAWRKMDKISPGAVIDARHLSNVLHQLRSAGYVVRKAKLGVGILDDDTLLSALLY